MYEQPKRNITIQVQLSEDEARALAEVINSISFIYCRTLSENISECGWMIDASVQLQNALAERGYAPR